MGQETKKDRGRTKRLGEKVLRVSISRSMVVQHRTEKHKQGMTTPQEGWKYAIKRVANNTGGGGGRKYCTQRLIIGARK